MTDARRIGGLRAALVRADLYVASLFDDITAGHRAFVRYLPAAFLRRERARRRLAAAIGGGCRG